MRKTNFIAADLFCGAGGTSAGLLKAAKHLGLNVELVAINHWDVAIATHTLNHPDVKHVNSDLEKVDPRNIVPGRKLDLLVASPECTHFSKARGGKPMSKQSRASVKYILRWISVLEVKNIVIENVPEFMDWGPLHRKGDKINTPIKNRKGEYFQRFIRKLKEQGYGVKYRVLNAADYGDPTTRKRLFIMARKNGNPVFPEPTHRKVATDMFSTLKAWKPARDIIDWSIKGESIFQRKRPLADNTMRRIMAGLMKFGGKAFVLGQQSGAAPRSTDEPLPTVAGAGAISFIEPFIVPQFSSGSPRSVEDPLNTITSTSRGIGLVEPFLVEYHNGKNSERRTRSVNEPMPTLDTSNRFGLAEPFVVMLNGTTDKALEQSNRSIDEPLPTVTGSPHIGMVEPFIMQMDFGGLNHDLHKPFPTLTSADSWALVDPFLVEYYGTGGASSIDDPLKTQTGRDRFGLVQPMIFESNGKRYVLDIRFRMLQPHELAGAMSFSKDYKFVGTREQIVKQIGNAVPTELAAALCVASMRSNI